MSWASDIRQTLDMLALVMDPVWQAEFSAKIAELQRSIAELAQLHQAQLDERKRKLPKPKPPKAPKPTKSPDADTVGTVKNMRPRRPFVHSVPPASLPGGHR